ncbi:MAG: cytidine deaminase [bacterium]
MENKEITGFEKLIRPFEEEVLKVLKYYNDNSYSPYSRFRVSACLVIKKNDKIYYVGGTNVENSSYGLSICAERNAVFKAIAEGYIPNDTDTSWLFIALYVPVEKFITPCGACRQVISEFVENIPIVIYNKKFERKILFLDEIFKEKFSPRDLK